MVTTFKYTAYSSASTALSTELDALTTDNYSALSAAIDNSSTLELYHDLEFLSGGSITPKHGREGCRSLSCSKHRWN